ncbi:MAG TPA: YfhO family protein [Acidimicrobiales bacterium]|nr:YfhO family protein [Acidimicrobiales bacterium]
MLAAIVVGFAGAWAAGTLVLDGPGISLYVRVAVDHLDHDGRVGYWIPEIWSGTPAWVVGPSFPILLLVPLGAAVGATTALKSGILALQVAGACGAYVLARSLWRSGAAALVSGVVYGVNPLVISHAALIASEGAVGVIAAAPWLVWSLRRGLRGDGTRYLVVAGLVAAFAVLHQAEYAYGLAMLCGLLLVVELAQARSGGGRATAGQLLRRAGVTLATALGAVAHWLVPFLALHQSFALSPPELVRRELFHGSASTLGRELGLFLHRSGGLEGVVTPDRAGLIGQVYYLGWVPVAVTLLTALFLARRDDDRTLSVVLAVSLFTVWLSTAAVSLADGGPVARGQVVPMVVLGAVAGLVAGGLVRRLRLGRARAPTVAAVALFLFVAPYLRPFLELQRVLPFLDSLRFPRFYVVAVLGLALGTAWPVARLASRIGNRRPVALLATGALALALVVGVVVDGWPYRSFYRVRGPADGEAYRALPATVRRAEAGVRVATPVDARPVDSLQRAGAQLSLGWPHPVAGKQLWRLTLEAGLGPAGYRQRALGLAGTAYVSAERVEDPGTLHVSVGAVELLPNPHHLPAVRAYDHALVVDEQSIGPELAVALAHRNMGVVTGGIPEEEGGLGATAIPSRVDPGSCEQASLRGLAPAVAGEVSAACGMHRWLPTMFEGLTFFGGNEAPGAVLGALADGLRGVSVWLDDPSGKSELVLRELGADGRSMGRTVARARSSGLDDYGMTHFGFDPIADSAGKRYLFEIECPECFSELAPQMLAGSGGDGTGNLVVGGRLHPDRLAAFAPVYERLPAAPASSTKVTGRRTAPNRWRAESSGTRPSLVVVAETNFPGWSARVDGRPAPVLEVDGAFLGVPVPAGTHVVTLAYHPPTAVVLGRLITAGTLAALVVGGLWARRLRRRKEAGRVKAADHASG